MSTRHRQPPQFTAQSAVLTATGALVGTALFGLPLKTTASLAIGAILGQLLFVMAVRRLHR